MVTYPLEASALTYDLPHNKSLCTACANWKQFASFVVTIQPVRRNELLRWVAFRRVCFAHDAFLYDG